MSETEVDDFKKLQEKLILLAMQKQKQANPIISRPVPTKQSAFQRVTSD